LIKEIFPFPTENNDSVNNSSEKTFLFSDRDISSKIINFNNLIFNVENPKEVTFPGQIEDVIHSTERGLSNLYRWLSLDKNTSDGFLVCYLDFVPQSLLEAKELKFKIYSLKNY